MNSPQWPSGGFMGPSVPYQQGMMGGGAGGMPPGGGWGNGLPNYESRGVFVGRFEMTLDEKVRFTVPAHWRSNIAGLDGGQNGFYLMPSDGAEMRLVAYPQEEMDIWSQRLRGLPHGHPDWGVIARLSTSAEYCPVDRNGRLTLPRRLSDYLAVFPRETVVLFGVIRRFEICSLALAPKEWSLENPED